MKPKGKPVSVVERKFPEGALEEDEGCAICDGQIQAGQNCLEVEHSFFICLKPACRERAVSNLDADYELNDLERLERRKERGLAG